MKLIHLAVATASLFLAMPTQAQEKGADWQLEADNHLISFNAEARLDWQYAGTDGDTNRAQTGFIGKYIALGAHGTLAKGLTYNWRQRFSRTPKDHTFWDQTDFLDINYKFGKWNIGAGKQVVLIGGYEYDRAPVNLMCPNIFVTNVGCYQFGVSGGVQLTPGDRLLFQISQSPYADATDRNMYAFNLMWRGAHSLSDHLRLETVWSLNEMEFEKGHYCNFVALGNKLVINERVTVLLDAITRTYPNNNFFKNNTFMAELSYNLSPAWKFTGKVSYDCNMGRNKTKKTEIARGSEMTMAGVVAEWYPIRNSRHTLRAHAAAFYSVGKNMNPAELMQDKTLYASVGLTWHMNFLNVK